MAETLEYLTRMAEIVEGVNTRAPIDIVGAGAIGSWATLCLHKVGFEVITCFDHDHVEVPNVGVQVYGMRHVTPTPTPKVRALSECMDLLGAGRTLPRGVHNKYVMPVPGTSVVVLGTDSKQSRRDIVLTMRNRLGVARPAHIVDIRTGAEGGVLHYVGPPNENWEGDGIFPEDYLKTLEGDDQAAPCGRLGSPFSAMMAGALVAKTVVSALSPASPFTPAAWLSWDLDRDLNPSMMVMQEDWIPST